MSLLNVYPAGNTDFESINIAIGGLFLFKPNRMICKED